MDELEREKPHLSQKPTAIYMVLNDVCPGVYIPAAAERVNIVLGFVYRLYTRRRANGWLNVDPPTVGHVYSLLADGMKAFESGRSLCVSSSNCFPYLSWFRVLLMVCRSQCMNTGRCNGKGHCACPWVNGRGDTSCYLEVAAQK